MSSLGYMYKQAWSGQLLLGKHTRNNDSTKLDKLPTQTMQLEKAMTAQTLPDSVFCK